MSRNKLKKAPELAEVLRRHLSAGKGQDDQEEDRFKGWARWIIAIRGRGSENFLASESRAQLLDLLKPVGQLRLALAAIERADRRLLQAAMTASIRQQTGKWNTLKVSDFERALELLEQIIESSKSHSGLVASTRKLAHDAVDWRRLATAHACRLVWARNARHLQTPRWLTYAKELPEILARPDGDHWDLIAALEGFSPKSINRDAPSAFGKFVQDVLTVFPERDSNGEPFNASDTMRALRRVQERRSARR